MNELRKIVSVAFYVLAVISLLCCASKDDDYEKKAKEQLEKVLKKSCKES